MRWRSGMRAIQCMWYVALTTSLWATTCLGDTTEFLLHNTTYTCLGQPYTETAPLSWISSEQELVRIGENSTHDPCDNSEGNPYPLSDLSLVRDAGKVVVAPLSNCSTWEDWEDYRRDVYRRMQLLGFAHPRGIIFGEAHAGKLPEWLWSERDVEDLEKANIGLVPTCVMSSSQFERLNAAIDEFGGHGADFSKAYMYNPEDDPILEHPVTTIEIKTKVGDKPTTINLAAGTSSFNPLQSDAIDAPIVIPEFKKSCIPDFGQTLASRNFSQCAHCWSDEVQADDGPLKNAEKLQGSVVFFDLSGGSPPCYSWLYHFAVMTQRHGAKGVIIGGSSKNGVWIPYPHLVSEEITIPTFSVSKTSSDIILHSIEVSSTDPIMVHLPNITDRSGSPFYAPGAFQVGLADIAFWDESYNVSGFDYASHFECSAVYTTINDGFKGIAAPAFEDGKAVNGTLVKRARAYQACRSSSHCGECFHQVNKVVFGSKNPHNPGDVILIREEDFTCFSEIHQYVEAVAHLDPGGLILNLEEGEEMLHSGFNSLEYSFPVVTIGQNCIKRVILDEDELYVSFARMENGTQLFAGSSVHREHDELEETVIKVDSPKSVKGVYLAGQSEFNPANSTAIKAAVAVVDVNPKCSDEANCHLCDLERWKFDRKISLDGKIALYSGALPVVLEGMSSEQDASEDISNLHDPRDFDLPTTTLDNQSYSIKDQGWCLKPFTSVVSQAQELGAVAVLFVNWDNSVYTYEVPGHKNITIPSFNIPLNVGIPFIWEAKRTKDMILELPEVLNGGAMTLDQFLESGSHSEEDMHSGLQLAVEERLKLIEANEEGLKAASPTPSSSHSKHHRFPRAAIGSIVGIAGLLLLIGVAVLIWRSKTSQSKYFMFMDDTTEPIEMKKAAPEPPSCPPEEGIQAGLYRGSDSQEIELSAVDASSFCEVART